MFEKARQCKYALIAIDEAEYLFGHRTGKEADGLKNIKSKLLMEMGNIVSNPDSRIVIIATTNLPQDIDPSFVRRFQSVVYVRIPDRAALQSIIWEHLAAYELDNDVTKQSIHNLATKLASDRRLTGSDIYRAVSVELRSYLLAPMYRATHFKHVSHTSFGAASS